MYCSVCGEEEKNCHCEYDDFVRVEIAEESEMIDEYRSKRFYGKDEYSDAEGGLMLKLM